MSENQKQKNGFIKPLYYKNSGQNLSVYKAVSGLGTQFERSTQKFPAAIKTTECYAVQSEITMILCLITAAQDNADNLPERARLIKEAISRLKRIEIMNRQFLARKLLKSKGFSAISLLEDDAIRQFDGWLHYTITAIEKKSNKK